MVYTIDEIKRAVTPIARKYGLRAVYLFGSYARGTAADSSDIDLLIDTTGTDIKSLLGRRVLRTGGDLGENDRPDNCQLH